MQGPENVVVAIKMSTQAGRTHLMPKLFLMVSRKPGKTWEVNSTALFAMPRVQTSRLKPFHTPVSLVSPAMVS